MKSDSSAPRRGNRVSVVSLEDERVVRSIFEKIGHTTASNQELRRNMFRKIAESPALQHMLLDLLSQHPEIQRAVLQELAKSPRLKRKFVVFADEQTTKLKPRPHNKTVEQVPVAPDRPAEEQEGWRKLYREAMLELDPQKVPSRIAAALENIVRRSLELQKDPSKSLEEREEMAEAVAGLKFWERLNSKR